MGRKRRLADISEVRVGLGAAFPLAFQLTGFALLIVLFVVPIKNPDPEAVEQLLWWLPYIGLGGLVCQLVGMFFMNYLTHSRRALELKAGGFLLLFASVGVYSGGLYHRCDPSHFDAAGTPGVLDWAWYVAAHATHAGDLLDVLHEYRVDLRAARPVTTEARAGVFVLYVATGLYLGQFLAAVMAPQAGGVWRRRTRWAARAGIAVAAAGCLWRASAEGWRPADWAAFPVENVLRAADVADAMQVWGWHVHGVAPTPWTQALAVLTRLAVGVELAGLVADVRLYRLRGVGLRASDLIEEARHGADPRAALTVLAARLAVTDPDYIFLRSGDEDDLGRFLRDPGVTDPGLRSIVEDIRASFVERLRGAEHERRRAWNARVLALLGPDGVTFLASRCTGGPDVGALLRRWDTDADLALQAIREMGKEARPLAPSLLAFARDRTQPVDRRKAVASVLAMVAPDVYRAQTKRA